MAELVWEGKYDASGERIAPLKVSLPFQTVETVNESAQERQRSLDLFNSGRDSEWRNRLIWGDNKYVLPALLEEFAGRVDLIYIDPPFGTGQNFSFITRVDGEGFAKEPSIIEQKAYRDTWGRGLDSYLQMMADRLLLMHQLLSDTGTIYVHMDPSLGHHIKVIMDEVFGADHHRNTIAWCYRGGGVPKGSFARKHDLLLFYTKSDTHFYEPQYVPYSEASQQLVRGRGGVSIDDRPRDLERGAHMPDWWTDINSLQTWSPERVGFETQKPEALLTRIIAASSREGSLVADPFVGSGTTAAVAERLGRRWVVCDLGRFAVHTTRKRLLSIEGVKPFVVQNLGKYERQLWQVSEFGDEAEKRTFAYRRFILELYKAKPIDSYVWLHGVKTGAMVHVGTVDAPVTVGDVKQIAAEFRKAVGTGTDAPSSATVDVLGWDFAFELNEVAKQEAAVAGIQMRFVRIPREVLDRRAVEQGDVHFHELAALGVNVQVKKRTVTLKITEFVIPLDDVPEAVQRTVKSWSQWIDYWAVDWDNKDDTFHNEWQTYRTKDNRKLELATAKEYDDAGEYRVVVKVVDILGNDTTKSIEVLVK